MATTRPQLSSLQLKITVLQTVTVLPRCLQILSRRGFMLTDLTTEDQSDGSAVLACTILGPASWHVAIPSLLLRLNDVTDVDVVKENDND